MLTPRRQFLLLLGSIAAGTVLRAPPAGSFDGPPVPDSNDLIELVRSTMLAVDTGNKTGDYSALHAMGGPPFQAAYPPAKLAVLFEKLRASQTDLAVLQEKMPLTSRPPTLDLQGRLRILGYFELPNKQIVYDVLYDYDKINRGWLLAAISVTDRILPPQPELMQPR